MSQTIKKKVAKSSSIKKGLSIETQGISRDQVKQLKSFLADHLGDETKIRQDGRKLIISSKEGKNISKTKIKPYLKRFLYLENLRTKVRILTAGPRMLLLYQPGYVEETE
ncbi:MAG: hypothetical protein ACTSW4_07640 [Candidatus Ranarchaeia archaeon]